MLGLGQEFIPSSRDSKGSDRKKRIPYLLSACCEGKFFKIFRSIGEKAMINVVGKGSRNKTVKDLGFVKH